MPVTGERSELFGEDLKGWQEGLWRAGGGALLFGGPSKQLEYTMDPYQVDRSIQASAPEEYMRMLTGEADAQTARAQAEADRQARMDLGSTLAQQQLREGQEQQISAARSIAASQPGITPAQALRASQEAASNIGQRSTRQAALLRAREADMASKRREALLDRTAARRSALMGQAAQMGQQTDLANLQARVALEQAQQQAVSGEQQRAQQVALANMQAQGQDKGLLGGLFG